MKKQVTPLFEAVKVHHDLWNQDTDITFQCEYLKCTDTAAINNCYYKQQINSQEDVVKEYDDLDEDEDAFGAKSRKIVVQL